MPAHLKPPVGLPTPLALAEDEAWSSLVATQLTDMRKTAESWRTGLVALIGLITTLSLVKGPEDVNGLDQGVAYAVGLLLLLALACAAVGAWTSLTAAYGRPSIMTREAFHDLGGIDGYRLEMARKSASNLRLAQVATVATLIFLALAVGLTWYGPRFTSVTLYVESKSRPNICGKLMSSRDGYMVLKPSASQAVRVDMPDLAKVTAVEKCP